MATPPTTPTDQQKLAELKRMIEESIAEGEALGTISPEELERDLDEFAAELARTTRRLKAKGRRRDTPD